MALIECRRASQKAWASMSWSTTHSTALQGGVSAQPAPLGDNSTPSASAASTMSVLSTTSNAARPRSSSLRWQAASYRMLPPLSSSDSTTAVIPPASAFGATAPLSDRLHRGSACHLSVCPSDHACINTILEAAAHPVRPLHSAHQIKPHRCNSIIGGPAIQCL